MKKNALLIPAALVFPVPAFAEGINFSEQIAEGGVAIVVIIALSILALAVTIERVLHFRKKF
ncbi:MAG: hypothetical protein EOO68_37375, partial [Moraxellaceae bacterium]